MRRPRSHLRLRQLTPRTSSGRVSTAQTRTRRGAARRGGEAGAAAARPAGLSHACTDRPPLWGSEGLLQALLEPFLGTREEASEYLVGLLQALLEPFLGTREVKGHVEEASEYLVGLLPALGSAHVDDERHREVHFRLARRLHHPPHHLRRALRVVRVHFENQLVVHLRRAPRG